MIRREVTETEGPGVYLGAWPALLGAWLALNLVPGLLPDFLAQKSWINPCLSSVQFTSFK